ncbi:hypothetical protein JKP88DRAFT_265565 [Tribonema minus]|uniref:Peptidase S54 rhomboid domain-containing protein n=1 Tax=Tribonema minus TaxID=303371 RepID=A0A835YKD5_9STRA|nr:hypothetical protein JKP88DRAFT_265565 [Tribonema minus]
MSRRFPALWLYTKALGALLGLCLVSLWYHAGLWRGVVVQGARNPALDGYYHYNFADEPTQPMYVQNARRLGPRLPDVFGLSALTPVTAGEDAKQYLLQQDNRGHWGLGLRGALTSHYVSTDPSPPGTEAPPQTGWVAVRARASGAPPIIRAVWRAEPAPKEWRGRRGGWEGDGGGLAALAAMPGTAVLLAVNVAAALWLWVRRVPPEAVAVSYAAVVQDKQYWRCVTASFSHFEPLHLGFNMMSLYNSGPLEQDTGNFKSDSHFEPLHLGFHMMSLYNTGPSAVQPQAAVFKHPVADHGAVKIRHRALDCVRTRNNVPSKYMGTVRYLYLSAALVAATMATVLLLQRAAIARSAPDAAEALRSSRAVGYSCVLFAFMTAEAVLQPEFCPLPFAEGLCFATHALPPPLPAALRVNAGPFALLLVVQAVMPRAGFLGHLAGG